MYTGNVPSANPGSKGCRLPHSIMQMRRHCPSAEVTFSTDLELASGDKVEFLLIIAPAELSYHLAREAFKFQRNTMFLQRFCGLLAQIMELQKMLQNWKNVKM